MSRVLAHEVADAGSQSARPSASLRRALVSHAPATASLTRFLSGLLETARTGEEWLEKGDLRFPPLCADTPRGCLKEGWFLGPFAS